jgi:hypothetical protein
MEMDIRDAILKHFPADERLVYEDFMCDDIASYYYRNESRIRRVFELISCPWTEIQWAEVTKIDFDGEGSHDGYLVIPVLNRKSFIHVFPSLLVEVAENISMTADYFVSTHLDLRSVFRDWELEFYFSCSEDIVRLVNRALRENGAPWAQDAIDVYWHEAGAVCQGYQGPFFRR